MSTKFQLSLEQQVTGKQKLESASAALADLTMALVHICESTQKLPRHEVSAFLKAYESLFTFEKQTGLLPWFSRSMKRTADYLTSLQQKPEQISLSVQLSDISIARQSLPSIKSQEFILP